MSRSAQVTHGRIRLHIMHSGRFEMEAQSWGSLCDENDVDMKMFGEIDPDDEAAAQVGLRYGSCYSNFCALVVEKGHTNSKKSSDVRD
eukprot:1209251-Pleurochrysis_carterae.AAC.1